MTSQTDEMSVVFQSDSVMTAVIPALLFGFLTMLAEPPWSAVDGSMLGYTLLTVAHFLPLFVLILPSKSMGPWSWIAIGIASASGVALCVHAGLSGLIVEAIDEGRPLSKQTVMPVLEVFLSAIAVPAALLVASGLETAQGRHYLWLPALFAALAQVLWFGIQRLWLGPSGLEFWFASRIIVHAAMGVTAGFIASSFRDFRPRPYPFHWGGLTELIIMRLPSAPAFSVLLGLAILMSGVARVAAEHADRGRWVTVRVDDYFLSLTNLKRAQQAGLVYEELHGDLERARRALLGAVSFDPTLSQSIRMMLGEIEAGGRKGRTMASFKRSVMAVNRRMLSTGAPYFLEPHTIGSEGKEVNFLFRYRIIRRGRYGLTDGPSVPMIRLRRMDGILVDTPYTGLSYDGLGTVLMDHIDDEAIRSYARLFSAGALRGNPEEGRFQETALLLRKDRREALVLVLAARGHTLSALERLAVLSEDIQPVIDLTNIRERMDDGAVAAYDHLAEMLARQTEVHEARHALDKGRSRSPPLLVELGAGALSAQATAEIRAYLTEIIDGPLGPKFGLSTVGKMIIGENARANAYFFAAVVILEGLWGERIRRPDLVAKEDATAEEGAKYGFLPITKKHPGWLSYSRIFGAYSDLSALTPDELRTRARGLFGELFGEEYVRVERRR